MSNSDTLHKAARLAYLALMLEARQPGRPPKHEFDTANLARDFGVTQRSIQRDLHEAWKVREFLCRIKEAGK